MLSTAQQMLQDSRTKIELLRMQIIKVSQARDGGHGGSRTMISFNQKKNKKRVKQGRSLTV